MRGGEDYDWSLNGAELGILRNKQFLEKECGIQKNCRLDGNSGN